MTMTDQHVDTTLRAWVQARGGRPAPLRLRQRILAIPTDESVQRRMWLPPFQPPGYRSMSSVVKFAAAAAIVALFGGFLLTGVLTTPQADEMAPAAVTESPSPETDESVFWPEGPEGPAFLPGPTTTDELLAEAVTEEVAPGVLQVVNDGVVDLVYRAEGPIDIVAGHDGGIWVLGGGGYHRLGEGLAHIDHTEGEVDFVTHYLRGWPVESDQAHLSDFEVAPDGTVRAVFTEWDEDAEEVVHLYSVGGGSDDWTRTTGRANIEVTSDGTAWAVWRDDPGDPDSLVLGYLAADGWQPLGEWPYGGGHSALYVSDRGDVWAVGVDTRAHHFVDGAWRTDDEGKLYRRGDLRKDGIADVGVDGTLWSFRRDDFVRFDGTEWRIFEPPDWMPRDVGGWRLVEDEWVLVSHPEPSGMDTDTSLWYRLSWGEPHVASDGSLWIPARLGEWDGQGRSVCDRGIDGVARFDGEAWSRFLQGYCIQSMDIAADGSVWLLATESDARFPLIRTYVITREAVAASE